jgi:DNA-binding Lrp family transcriptional regulator
VTGDALSDLDRRVLTEIQAAFPIAGRPYAELAGRLGVPEVAALESVRGLRAAGFIRRIGAIFDSARLGYRSTLCAIAAPRERIGQVADLISEYPNVTHNYERADRYSVWFTLIAPSQERIDEILVDIAARSGIDDLLDLPAVRLFKIRVDFDLTGEREAREAPAMTSPAAAKAVALSEDEKALVRLLQADLPDLEAPFEVLATELAAQGDALTRRGCSRGRARGRTRA